MRLPHRVQETAVPKGSCQLERDPGSRRDRPAKLTDQRRNHQARLIWELSMPSPPRILAKLPDANLAESLQRITGVSIDRTNGEGAFVTVRGFGPEFNTVLVNGRQLATPTGSQPRPVGAHSRSTPSPPELVSGVEVYKTSTARLQSRRRQLDINIKTAQPFDYDGFKFASSDRCQLRGEFQQGRTGRFVSAQRQVRRRPFRCPRLGQLPAAQGPDKPGNNRTIGSSIGGTPDCADQRRYRGCDHTEQSARKSVRSARLRHPGVVREPPADGRHLGVAVSGQ